MHNLFEKAEFNYKIGKFEDAFLLYSRVIYMRDIVRAKSDYPKVERSRVSFIRKRRGNIFLIFQIF
jgi:hypothetical protein